MSDDNQLSDDEYAALLRDLEGGGGGGGKAAGGAADDEGGIEDIDAFLSSLEEEADESATKTATAEREEDPLAAEFAALEAKGELVAPPPEETKPKKEKKKEKKRDDKPSRGERREQRRAEKEAKKEAKRQAKEEAREKRRAEGEGRGKAIAKAVALNTLWFGPALIFWWVLGSYLGHWVSAGWLIAAMSTLFVFGVPAILKKVVQKGEYRPWLLGFSVVLAVALIAPMPNQAGEAMTRYGHWPASTVAEITGAAHDAAFVRANAGVGGWIGGLVATQENTDWGARQLGSEYALTMERPTAPARAAEPDGDPEAEPAPAAEPAPEAEPAPAAEPE